MRRLLDKLGITKPQTPSWTRAGTLGDPWSSLGPNTTCAAVGTGGTTVSAYYKRQSITLSCDAGATGQVYCLCGAGTPSASNFHFALSSALPPVTTQYTGPIQMVASTGTIHVGVLES